MTIATNGGPQKWFCGCLELKDSSKNSCLSRYFMSWCLLMQLCPARFQCAQGMLEEAKKINSSLSATFTERASEVHHGFKL